MDLGPALELQAALAGPALEVVHVDPNGPGLSRRRAGRGFRYVDHSGHTIREPEALRRLRALAIPPAWQDVWICPVDEGHIQATGRDAKGRLQYLYHPHFRRLREADKFEHLLAFAEGLPPLRTRVGQDMGEAPRSRNAVLATVVRLLDTTLIRVGGAAYAKTNKSYGLTTLQRRHVDVAPGELRFHFKGKSGRVWRLSVHDRRVVRIVRACQELPGQSLFQYLDENGETRTVRSEDVNAYLRSVTGQDVTAKDFRTWNGTVLAARSLAGMDPTLSASARKKALSEAIAQVSRRLGNTTAICRKCYVHPAIMEAFLAGRFSLDLTAAPPEGFDEVEWATLGFLKAYA